jgi:hypothetical protein
VIILAIITLALMTPPGLANSHIEAIVSTKSNWQFDQQNTTISNAKNLQATR